MGRENISEKKSMCLSKFLACIFGLITIGLSFLCQYVGSTVLQISLSIFGLLGGPLLGVISLGLFVPCANATGALVGLITSVFINCFIGIGAILYGAKPALKDLNTNLCENNSTINLIANISTNFQTEMSNATTILTNLSEKTGNEGIWRIFDISYYWYSLIAMIIVFVLGTIVSMMTRKYNKKDLDDTLFFSGLSKIINKRNRGIYEIKSESFLLEKTVSF